MGIFKAYDIRGIYPSELDEKTAYRIGYFLPELLDVTEVLVGRDGRLSSPSLFESFRDGVLDAGADCIDLGLATTPYIYFATIFLGKSASVQITASHNDGEYNGFKISGRGAFPIGSETGLAELEKLVREGKTEKPVMRGESLKADVRFAYMNYQRRFMENLDGLDVTFDLSNGATCVFAKELFGSGHGRHYIFDSIDGKFPNHSPNPLEEKNCEALKKAVIVNKSDCGVIFDGDGDRVVFIDEKGRMIQPDYIISLVGLYYKKFRGFSGPALCDIRTSKSTTEYLKSIGFEPVWWKVGHSNAKRKLREIDGAFGGELAGHYYFRDFYFCDSGIHAAVVVLEVIAALKKSGQTLSSFIDKIVKYSNSGERNFKIENKDAAIEKIISVYKSKAIEIMDFDGIRYDFGSWWFNLRKSNTEPYLRLIVEAQSREELDRNFSNLEKIIKSFK